MRVNGVIIVFVLFIVTACTDAEGKFGKFYTLRTEYDDNHKFLVCQSAYGVTVIHHPGCECNKTKGIE